jgi:pyridoxal phosphate enzyme (YggS family)
MAANPSDEPSATAIAANLADVHQTMAAAHALREVTASSRAALLVAVSKTKSVEAIMAAYGCGQRCFGENYVQEIEAKAPLLPPDIEWHFIGHLQSNKASSLLEAVPNLAVLHTVDSAKLASKVNQAVEKVLDARRQRRPLDVFIQVNTSGEESKSGVAPGPDVATLAKFIAGADCPNLRLAGLMTIGMPDYTSRKEDFVCLAQERQRVSEATGIAAGELELSMGMSGDYEQAIVMGSTVVRVGSKIFGARAVKPH